MLKTVHDVVNRIAEYYKPEKIILYGSYNTENRKNSSLAKKLIEKLSDIQTSEEIN